MGRNLLCPGELKISETDIQKEKGVWCMKHTRRTTGAG